MNFSPLPPTNELRASIIELLGNGIATHLDPLFPGIPIYGDDEPENAVAPYIVVDLTADPQPWKKSHYWAFRTVVRLVQPIAIPDDPSVSLDYDSLDQATYEHNLAAIILGAFPKVGIAYNSASRATYRNLSDWLTLSASVLSHPLVLLDVAQLHRPDNTDAGLPIRAKMEIADNQDLEFDFLLVAALEDTEL